MSENKTSDAQLRANKKWNDANKEKLKKIRVKSGCRVYIRDFANLEDLEEVKEWIKQKEKSLNQEEIL